MRVYKELWLCLQVAISLQTSINQALISYIFSSSFNLVFVYVWTLQKKGRKITVMYQMLA